jgi:hypothetical protein
MESLEKLKYKFMASSLMKYLQASVKLLTSIIVKIVES